MRVWHFVSGFFFVVPSLGCQDATKSLGETVAAQAMAEAASAQAMGSAAVAQSQTSITGSVHSAGGDLGTWDIVLNDCQSGEYNGFFGVDFYVAGSKEMRLRYVHDEATGEVVKVPIPPKNDTLVVLDRNLKCAVLEGSLEKTNFTTWTPKGKIRHVNGHVKFDCKHDGGKGHVTGEATFSHCH